jgi:CBS domain-containing protein
MEESPTVISAKRFEIYSLREDAALLKACQMMVEKDISSLVIVNDEGYLSGIITRTDLLRARLENDHWSSVPVRLYMNNQVVTVTPETKLFEVSKLLVENHIHRIVVVQMEDGKKRPLSVLSDSDIIYHMTKEY